MGKYITVDTEVNLGGIDEKLMNLFSDSTTKLEVHNTFAKMCDPYVPFLNGPLSQSVFANITPEYVQYGGGNVPYARYQYYGVWFNHTKDVHPLATAKWDQAMMRDHREEFVENVKAILVRRYKELYG